MLMNQRERVDRVGLTDVFVEPIPDSALNLTERNEVSTRVHLRVVDQMGHRFTEKELGDWMSLDHNTIGELIDLCSRRRDVLCAKYLPGTVEPEVTQVHCWIGPDDIADVEILLQAVRRN